MYLLFTTPLCVTAVAEPPSCLAVAVAFALREALVSSREETGYPRNKWFNVGKLNKLNKF